MRDVVIIGAGPAGLSAALILGRCRRDVVVCDRGTPRNARSRHLHGYLTRDGIDPRQIRSVGREELAPYGIEIRDVTVVDVQCMPGGFEVRLDTGERLESRTVLLATGVQDRVPDIEGIDACYGISAFHCPYCDGWEVRGKRLVVVAQGPAAASLALSLKTWSDDVVICSNGRSRLATTHRGQLAGQGIAVHNAAILKIDHEQGHARHMVLANGTSVPVDAIFFSQGQKPQCDLPRQLGCELTTKGVVKTDHLGQTRVPGIYVAGDASRDVQFAIVAAAEGAKAGVAINKALQALAGHAAAPVQS